MQKRFVSAGICPVNGKLYRNCYDRTKEKEIMLADDIMDFMLQIDDNLTDEEIIAFIKEKMALDISDEKILRTFLTKK